MAEILTREQMIEQMLAVALQQEALGQMFVKAHEANKEESLKKEGMTEELYDKTALSYMAGYSHASEPWIKLLEAFQAMPLYHTKD